MPSRSVAPGGAPVGAMTRTWPPFPPGVGLDPGPPHHAHRRTRRRARLAHGRRHPGHEAANCDQLPVCDGDSFVGVIAANDLVQLDQILETAQPGCRQPRGLIRSMPAPPLPWRAVDVSQIGRFLLVAALVLAVTGLLLLLAGAVGLGRLPGDLAFGRRNVRIYVPIATSIVLSIVATIVLNLLSRR